MANDIVIEARILKDKHRGDQFNINFASVENIRKIANSFTSHKMPNVENIKSINKIVQYMIAAKMVGYNSLYQRLNDLTGNELDKFCEDIAIEDNCYDNFDKAIDRHLYRENPRIYEYLKTKHIRYLDAGLIKFSTCHDIFLPDYKSIIDVASWKAELEVKELIENSQKDYVDFASTYKLRSIGNFVYADNKLRCTSRRGDPVDLDDAYIYEAIVDESFDFDEFNLNNFEITGLYNGNESIKTYRKVKIDQLHQGDEVLLNGGLVYRNEQQKCYMIVGPHKFVHLNKYENLNKMSLVYLFKDSHGSHVDMIRLYNLSCDTIDLDNWCEDHSEDELKQGFLYLVKGRTIITKMKNNNKQVTYQDILKLLESV